MHKKATELKPLESKLRKQKIIRYALSKGFTYDEIMNPLKEIL